MHGGREGHGGSRCPPSRTGPPTMCSCCASSTRMRSMRPRICSQLTCFASGRRRRSRNTTVSNVTGRSATMRRLKSSSRPSRLMPFTHRQQLSWCGGWRRFGSPPSGLAASLDLGLADGNNSKSRRGGPSPRGTTTAAPCTPSPRRWSFAQYEKGFSLLWPQHSTKCGRRRKRLGSNSQRSA
jgi:hypothetical protein